MHMRSSDLMPAHVIYSSCLLLGVYLLTFTSISRAGLPETIDRIKTSIVAIGTYQKTRSPPFVFRGTGFAVGDGTMVATNAHVLPDQLKTEQNETLVVIPMAQAESQPRDAKMLSMEKTYDLALLRITGTSLPPLVLQESAVREGETFAFTGFPLGNALGLSPVTHRAMVSALTPIALPSANARLLDPKTIQRLKSGAFSVFQLDATAYPGNSGSPLYDMDTARVVGIINMVFVKGTKEAALSQPSGISFAVPIEYLRELLRNTK